jgi:hypothetical protein
VTNCSGRYSRRLVHTILVSESTRTRYPIFFSLLRLIHARNRSRINDQLSNNPYSKLLAAIEFAVPLSYAFLLQASRSIAATLAPIQLLERTKRTTFLRLSTGGSGFPGPGRTSLSPLLLSPREILQLWSSVSPSIETTPSSNQRDGEQLKLVFDILFLLSFHRNSSTLVSTSGSSPLQASSYRTGRVVSSGK